MGGRTTDSHWLITKQIFECHKAITTNEEPSVSPEIIIFGLPLHCHVTHCQPRKSVIYCKLNSHDREAKISFPGLPKSNLNMLLVSFHKP